MDRRRVLLLGLAGVGSIPLGGVLGRTDVDGSRTVGATARGAFGAVGDGVADDTSAVQALIDGAASAGTTAVIGAGTYRCTRSLLLPARAQIRLDRGAHLLKDWTAPPGLANAFLRNVSFAGKADGLSITGPGTIGAVDHRRTGVIIALYGDDVRLRDVTVDTYAGGQAVMFAGDRGRIDGVTITNSAPETGTGGIRMVGGEDLVVTDCHVESGDDCLQFVPIGSPGALLYDMDIRRSTYVRCTGRSAVSRFMVALLEWTGGDTGMTASVDDCSFVGCRGTGANRAIVVKNTHSSGALERIAFVDCAVDMAGSTDRDSQEIRLQTGDTHAGAIRGISFIRTDVRHPVNASLRVGGPNITDVTFEGCTFAAPSGVATSNVVADAATRLTFRDCTFEGLGGKRPLTAGPTVTVTDLSVDRCRFLGMGDGVWGVNLVAVHGAGVVGCAFVEAPGSTTARAIRTSATTRRAVLRDNDCSAITNRTKITDGAPDTVMIGNTGVPDRS